MIQSITKQMTLFLCSLVFCFMGLQYTAIAKGALQVQTQEYLVINTSDDDALYPVRIYSEMIMELRKIISMDFENVPRMDVLEEIARKADLGIAYNSDLDFLKEEVTLPGSAVTIGDALIMTLEGTGYEPAISSTREIVLNRNEDDSPSAPGNPSEALFQQTVTGTVTDAETGDGIPGVNVAVEGTTTGAITDVNGQYELTLPHEDATLVFSYVGFITQRVSVNQQESIDVTLAEDIAGLEEIIVVGYGTVQKSDLTGSVERVRGEQFQTQNMSQITDMLTGTVAGFYAQQGTSAAGGSSMEIRGATSLLASTEPLIVLDGVIYNGSLRDINPHDVETIDILKDASSAAVYGAKSASGVVLITTTRGGTGRPVISFNSETGLTQAAGHHRPLGPEEFLQFRGDYLRTIRGFDETPRHYYTHPEELPAEVGLDEWVEYSDSPHSDPTREYLNRHLLSASEREQYLAGEPADWYDMVMGSGLRQTYNLSIAGGTDNSSYYWSVGYLDNEGIIRGDQYSGIRSRMNVDFQIVDWLNVGVNAQVSERDESAVMASLGRTYRVSPWGRAYNEDGSLNLEPQELATAEHPLMEIYGRDRERKIRSMFSSVHAQISLPFGIEHRTSFQPRYTNLEDYNFYGDNHATGYRAHDRGFGTRNINTTFEWMLDNLMTWDQDFGMHRFDVTLLHSMEQIETRSNTLENQSFSPNRSLGFHALQFGSSPYISNNDTEARGDALMARLNYTLLDRYLFTASIRRDGYSAFGQDRPRATFPAAAFAWQISEEDFFDVDVVNSLKLRLSWGVNGNRDIGVYSSLAQLSSNPFFDGSNLRVGTTTSTMANPLLAWERTESFNIGLDIGLLENRIDLTMDVYDATTTDLLMERRLPRITGFNSVSSNLGELGNRGFEMTMRTVNVNTPGFSWRTNLMFSLNRNEIKALFGDQGDYTLLGEERSGELPDFTNNWFPGQAIDVVWDYDVIGIWQEDEAGEAVTYGLRPGDFRVADVSGNGSYDDVLDKQFIGHTDPRYRLGMRNDVHFLGNWHASVFIRADLGHIAAFNSAQYGSSEFDRFSMSARPVPYWTPENPINDYARLDHSSNSGAYGGGLTIYRPSSFVRIQDISLSYTLDAELISSLGLNDLQVYSSVRNLYSFDNWPGFDPESGGNPMPRTFTLGFRLSL